MVKSGIDCLVDIITAVGVKVESIPRVSKLINYSDCIVVTVDDQSMYLYYVATVANMKLTQFRITDSMACENPLTQACIGIDHCT